MNRRTFLALTATLAVAAAPLTGCAKSQSPTAARVTPSAGATTPAYVMPAADCPLMPVTEIEKIVGGGFVLTTAGEDGVIATGCDFWDRAQGFNVMRVDVFPHKTIDQAVAFLQDMPRRALAGMPGPAWYATPQRKGSGALWVWIAAYEAKGNTYRVVFYDERVPNDRAPKLAVPLLTWLVAHH